MERNGFMLIAILYLGCLALISATDTYLQVYTNDSIFGKDGCYSYYPCESNVFVILIIFESLKNSDESILSELWLL